MENLFPAYAALEALDKQLKQLQGNSLAGIDITCEASLSAHWPAHSHELNEPPPQLISGRVAPLLQHANGMESIFSRVDELIRQYLIASKGQKLVKSAFVRVRSSIDLRYGIVLHHDNAANRKKIFQLLDFYACLDMSERIPVYFQVIPPVFETSFSNEQFIA